MKSLFYFLIALFVISPNMEAQKTYPTEKKITSVLSKYVDNNEVAGIITVVAKGDNILNINCLGYRDIENKKEMTNTTFWPTKKQLENFTPPYTKNEEGKLVPSLIGYLQYPLTDRKKRFPEAGGGIFSTPVDLVKFYQMVANKGVYKGKRIVSEKAIAEMGKKQTGDKVSNNYGLGWNLSSGQMGHGGACGTESKVYKDSGYVLMYIVQENNLKINTAIQKVFFDLHKNMLNNR